MKKKIAALLISAAIISTLAVGCGSTPSSGATNTSNAAGSSNSSGSKQTVTIKFWDRHPELKDILTQEVKDFEQKHPNIKVNFTEVPVTTQTQQYQSAVAGNSLPDVFTISGYSVAQFVKLKQLHSLNSIVTPAVQSEYPAGVFTPGYSMIGDQVYMVPLYAPYHGTEVLYYNKDILQKYGLGVPKTWDDLMKEGKEIYQKSGGKTYGMVMSFKQSDGQVNQMASAITPEVSVGFNYKTGRYEWNSDGYVQTMEFIKKLYTNHALDPDSATMSKAQARGALASGQAAFEMDGDWGGGLYLGLGFKNFGVTKAPTKDGAPYYNGYVGPTPEGISVYAKTKHWKETSLFVQYLMGHVYSAMVDEGLDTAKQVKPQNPKYPQITQIMALLAKTSVAVPNFYARKPATMDVIENFDSNKTKTTFKDILSGYVSGQVKSLPVALKKLSDQYNQELDQSIKASGGKVSKKDFAFPNWTPFKPYTQADYAQLKG